MIIRVIFILFDFFICTQSEIYFESLLGNQIHYEAPSFNIESIVGGETMFERVPYQVSLQAYVRPRKVVHFCGGSIITPNHILTAAHCINSHTFQKIVAYAGSNNLEDNQGIRIRIKRAYIHRKSKPYQHDIAVLLTEKPFDMMNSMIGTIKVFEGPYLTQDVPVTITGWGARLPFGYDYLPDFLVISNSLKALKYRTISNEDCRNMGAKMISTSQLCTKKGSFEGACVGDSGSPLVTMVNSTLYQVGIVSYGNAICGLPTSPDIYTRVSSYYRWIQQVVSIDYL